MLTILPPGSTVHSLLTNFTIFYSRMRYTTSTAAEDSLSNIVIDTSLAGRDLYELRGLEIGTPYWISVRAVNSMGMGAEPQFLTLTDTFGSGACVCVCDTPSFITYIHVPPPLTPPPLTPPPPAPTTAPNGLTLRITPDNTTLLAEWNPVITRRPTGSLAFYQVEFSSRVDGLVSILRINPDFPYSVISGVRDGNFYQVSIARVIAS